MSLLVASVCMAQLASAASALVPRGRELAAMLIYERRAIGGDGKVWSEKSRERFVRAGDHVWIERLDRNGAPAGRGAARRAAPVAGRHSVDVGRMARHFVRRADGKAAVALVSASDRLVVDLERADLSLVDASERFDDAWTLVPRGTLAALTRTAEAAPAGAEWRVREADGVRVRVLWSTALEFPLVVERARLDGRGFERMTVAVQATPATDDRAREKQRPWSGIAAYRHKDLSDFGD